MKNNICLLIINYSMFEQYIELSKRRKKEQEKKWNKLYVMYMYIDIDDDGNLNYLQIGIANSVIKTNFKISETYTFKFIWLWMAVERSMNHNLKI